MEVFVGTFYCSVGQFQRCCAHVRLHVCSYLSKCLQLAPAYHRRKNHHCSFNNGEVMIPATVTGTEYEGQLTVSFLTSLVKSIFKKRLRPPHVRPPLQNRPANGAAIQTLHLSMFHASNRKWDRLAVCEPCVQGRVCAVQTEVQW